MRYLGLFVAALLSLPAISSAGEVTWSGPITDVDGRAGTQYPASNVRLRYRPLSAGEKNLVLNNIRVQNVTDQKAIDIGCTSNPNGTIWGYENITISNYEAARINRATAGLHVDFLRIAGANPQGRNTNVTLNDVYVHDGTALPIIMEDGNFGTITLNDVQIERTSLAAMQLAFTNTGSADRVIIENSPGLHVAIFGRPGTVGEVIVRNSPGAVVSDLLTVYGQKSGVKILYDNSPSGASTGGTTSAGALVPEPASLGLIAIAATGLLRRRRA